MIEPGVPPAEEAAIQAVLDGTDSIELEADLVDESAETAVAPPAGDSGAESADEAGRIALPPAREESLFARLRQMPVSARVKLALRGNKDVRSILVRDSVRLVQRCVLQNPRVTVDEALIVAKNRSAGDELLRVIANNRDWVRQYQVRLALVTNPKTPLPLAMRLFGGLQERDVRTIAKSRNVSTVLQAQARRSLLQKQPAPSGKKA